MKKKSNNCYIYSKGVDGSICTQTWHVNEQLAWIEMKEFMSFRIIYGFQEYTFHFHYLNDNFLNFTLGGIKDPTNLYEVLINQLKYKRKFNKKGDEIYRRNE